MSQEKLKSTKMVIAIILIPLLLLLYFLYGAINGSIFIPGRDGAFTLNGKAAWVACLFPFLWVVGEFIRYSSKVHMNNVARKLLSFSFITLGVGMFIYSVLI